MFSVDLFVLYYIIRRCCRPSLFLFLFFFWFKKTARHPIGFGWHTTQYNVCVCSRLYFLLYLGSWWLRLIPCARIWSARPKNVVSSCPNPKSSQNISDCANWQECHLASTFGTVTNPNEKRSCHKVADVLIIDREMIYWNAWFIIPQAHDGIAGREWRVVISISSNVRCGRESGAATPDCHSSLSVCVSHFFLLLENPIWNNKRTTRDNIT